MGTFRRPSFLLGWPELRERWLEPLAMEALGFSAGHGHFSPSFLTSSALTTATERARAPQLMVRNLRNLDFMGVELKDDSFGRAVNSPHTFTRYVYL
jgi:hypothetical protein